MDVDSYRGEDWTVVGTGEITADSAAEESVCPKDWCEEVGMRPVAEGREMRLINASGGRI